MEMATFIKSFEEYRGALKPHYIEAALWMVENETQTNIILGRIEVSSEKRAEIIQELMRNGLGELAVLVAYSITNS